MVFRRKETKTDCRDKMSIVWEGFVLWHKLIVFPHARNVADDGARP